MPPAKKKLRTALKLTSLVRLTLPPQGAVPFMLRQLLALAIFTLAPAITDAQLIEITPATFAKVRQFADESRKLHPTSPTDALNVFIGKFNGEFGDIFPPDTFLVDSSALRVSFVTPIVAVRGQMVAALQSLEPLPATPPPNAVFGGAPVIGLNVTPKQMTAPNIKRVLIFRGNDEVETISYLAPQTFTNRMGAKTLLGAGLVVFRAAEFAPGAAIKVVAITDGQPMEWTISPAGLAAFRD